MARGKNSSSNQGNKTNTEISVAKIALIGTISVSLIGLIGTGINSYNSRKIAEAPVVIPLQATQTAQAIILTTSSPLSVALSQVYSPASISISTETATTAFPTIQPRTSLTDDPQFTSTPIPPPPAGFGALTIKTLAECSGSFSISLNEQPLTTVMGGERKTIVAGTYNIQPLLDIRGTPIRKTITIQEGDDKVLDFSNDLGLISITTYPNLNLPLVYIVYQNENVVGSFLSTKKSYCAVPGVYEISFSPSSINLHFEFDIKAGKTTTINPSHFPQQIGVLSFLSTKNETPTFMIFDQQTGEQIGVGNYRTNSMWVKVGIYKIVVSDPYLGLTYENIEITAGEETIVTLP